MGSFNACAVDPQGFAKLVNDLARVCDLLPPDRGFVDDMWPNLTTSLAVLAELDADRVVTSGAYRGHIIATALTPWVACRYLDLMNPEVGRAFLTASRSRPRAGINLLRTFAEGEAEKEDNSRLVQTTMFEFAIHSSLDNLHYVWDEEWERAANIMLDARSWHHEP